MTRQDIAAAPVLAPRPLPSHRAATGWLAVVLALAGGVGIASLAGPGVFDWQPALAVAQPWRALTAAGVHYSALHLAANLAGLALTAAFGIAADVPARAALAWLVAWPLTHLALLATPGLAHFGGLSGVLHAGVAVVAVWLLARATGARRAIGAAVAIGCVAKLVLETAWAAPWLRHPAGWDIATAPVAHLTGCAAGAACGLVAALWPSITKVRHG